MKARLVFGLMLSGWVAAVLSCDRSRPPPETPVSEAVDPANDIVAVLTSAGNLLCVTPEEEQRALSMLGARRAADGSYEASVGGSEQPLRFDVYKTSRPYVCSQHYREHYRRVSPVADLVALMPASGKVLCVRPDHAQAVLKMMRAESVGDGVYVATLPGQAGGEPLRFQLSTMLAPIMCMGGDDDDPAPLPGAGGGAGMGGRGGAPAVAGGPGTIIVGGSGAVGSGAAPSAGGPSGGRPGEMRCEDYVPPRVCEDDRLWGPPVILQRGIYTVYEHAECLDGFVGFQCTPGTGTSYKEVYDKHGTCGWGDGYCVSVKSIIGKRYVYDDDTCTTIPVREETITAGACYKVDNPNPPGPPGGEYVTHKDKVTLYRNATCGLVTPAVDHGCKDAPVTPLGGRYKQERRSDHQRCRRGNGYCVEAQHQIGTVTYYDLKVGDKCQAKLRDEPITAPACLRTQ